MSFCNKLRNARERIGYTQQQIADMMELDKSTYCGYETGKRQPDVFKIKQLCKILKISGDDLLETGFLTDNVSPSEPELTEGEMEFIQLLRQIPKEQQKIILDMVRAYSDNLRKG